MCLSLTKNIDVRLTDLGKLKYCYIIFDELRVKQLQSLSSR